MQKLHLRKLESNKFLIRDSTVNDKAVLRNNPQRPFINSMGGQCSMIHYSCKLAQVTKIKGNKLNISKIQRANY